MILEIGQKVEIVTSLSSLCRKHHFSVLNALIEKVYGIAIFVRDSVQKCLLSTLYSGYVILKRFSLIQMNSWPTADQAVN